MQITDGIALGFLRQVSAVPEGLAFLLAQCIANEEYGEQGVFDRLALASDDAELSRRIARHRADEVRHTWLLRECLAELKLPDLTFPAHLNAVAALDQAIGSLSTRTPRTERDLMELYLALQVLEERAVTQFPLFAQGLQGTRAGAVMATIGAEELLHVRYSEAAARRYAPSRAVHDATLAELRSIEERTFRDNSRGSMAFLLDQGWLRSGRIARVTWKAISAALRTVPVRMRTPFHTGARHV